MLYHSGEVILQDGDEEEMEKLTSKASQDYLASKEGEEGNSTLPV